MEVGAHVRGYNSRSVSAVLYGGITDWEDKTPANNYTPDQRLVLAAVVRTWLELWPDIRIVGHRDLNMDKDCPCFDVEAWLAVEGIDASTSAIKDTQRMGKW